MNEPLNTQIDVSMIIEIIKVIIWPIIVLIVILIFRKHIGDLISRITRIGYGSKVIDTSQQVQKEIKNLDLNKL